MRRAYPTPQRPPERGVAILMAMLSVSLVAVLASQALWQRHKALAVEEAERARVQASALLIGALDWARLILREDLRSGRTDHLAEPWAVGLEESRLSTFLAADKAQVGNLDGSDDVFLSGQVEDMQSRFNVSNLASNGQLNAAAVRTWVRLFEDLNLPTAEALRVAEALRYASDTTVGPGVAMAAVRPRRLADLQRLGLSAGSLQALLPQVSLLPTPTPINVNTASATVLKAALRKTASGDVDNLVERRAREPFKSLADVLAMAPNEQEALTEAAFSVGSRFFEVRGRLRVGSLVTQEKSLIQREALNDIRIVWRERSSELESLKLNRAQSGDALLQSAQTN